MNKEKQKPASDEQAEQSTTANKNSADSGEKSKASVRKLTWIVAGICFLFFLWYVAADRLTPSTNQARVRGYIVPIASQVSGVVSSVNVAINDIVENGEVLFDIDPEPFEIAVKKAQADLEKAGQDIGASTANVAAAQASLADARAKLNSVQTDANRFIVMEGSGVVPQARVDRARSDVEQAKEKVANAEADLQRAKEQLGTKGKENPKIRAALSALEKARFDLSNTSVRAPSTGAITNMKIDIGHYAQAGNPVMVFVSIKDVWVEAYMRENNLGNVKAGDKAEIVLDVAPGRVFKGTVASTGIGVKWEKGGSPGELPTISTTSGWLRDPQRFPVIIKFADNEAQGLRREGGQADVIIYTNNSIFFLNALAWIQIRLASLVSYVY